MVNIDLTILIISLNVKALHTLIKRQRLLKWIKKIQFYVVYKKCNFKYKDLHRLK